MLTLRRTLLFLVGCIGTRLLFVYLAFSSPLEYLPYLGGLALLPVFGWLYILITGSRKTGLEVGGERIWWNDLRPIHMLNYAAFSVAALTKNKNAYLLLAWDVILGLFAWINHHFISKV
jgi:hypothetical protein